MQPNKAIVGANAFAHESGIHQDGVIKHRETYEIMRAQDVGWHTNRMVLGKHSGRNALKTRFEELGIAIHSDEEFAVAFQQFKTLADKKHEIFDEDLHALVSDTRQSIQSHKYQLDSLRVESCTGQTPEARVELSIDGETVVASASGSGPVDAAFQAIESVAQSDAELQLYSVNAITSGTDSQGEVTVRLEKGGRIVNGYGADTDIVIASAKAYISALNLFTEGQKSHPQKEGV